MLATTDRSVIAAPILALVALMVLLAAGCGGNSDKKANEAYANSVCSAISSWTQQIKGIATDLSGGVSKASLQSKVTQAESATKDLATQIKAVPPPNTSDGQAAKKQVDQLSTQVTSAVDSAKSAVASIPANASVTTVAAALAPLASQVQGLASTAQSTVKSLQTAKGSLSSAFKSASSCKNLSG
jgi:uncharacterized protein (DUF2342 family)